MAGDKSAIKQEIVSKVLYMQSCEGKGKLQKNLHVCYLVPVLNSQSPLLHRSAIIPSSFTFSGGSSVPVHPGLQSSVPADVWAAFAGIVADPGCQGPV